MIPSARELIEAKEATAALLDAMDLDNYVFEVEPKAGDWEVHLECGHQGAWQTAVIPVDSERLLASRSSDAERQALLEAWRQRLTS